jgi:Condensation domain
METQKQGGQNWRPMLLLERTMYRDGRTPFTSLFTARLRGELREEQIREALQLVQSKHPLLRCVVANASAELPMRFVLLDEPAPIPLRTVERKAEDDWEREARREWVTPFAGERGPLLRVVWLRGRGAEVSELMLVAHHCICDGQSGLTLLRDLLWACEDRGRSLGSYSALGRLEELVPAAVLADRSFTRRVKRRQRVLRVMLWLKRGKAKLDGKSRGIPPERMYFLRWQMEAAETRRLAERCKQEQVTVLAAAGLSLTAAFRFVRGPRGAGKVNAMVNARRFLPQLPTDALFGLAPGVEMQQQRTRIEAWAQHADTGRADWTRNFWAAARAMKADLTQRVQKVEGSIHLNLASFEGLHERYEEVVNYFERRPAVPSLTFSNLGRLDLPEECRGLRVEKVFSPLVMVSPTPANTVVLSSFRGEMEFALVSDEESLPRSEAERIREMALEFLRQCVRNDAVERVRQAATA